MKSKNLISCFNAAQASGAKYIGVAIVNTDYPGVEVIINPRENFRDKMNYYNQAYNDDLVLKACDKIKIAGFTYGNTIEEIGKDLLG